MREALGSLARICYGKSPADYLAPDGDVPVIGTGGIYARAARSLFERGVVVARKGSLGTPHLMKRPFWPSDTTFAVLPNDGVDLDWLYFNLLGFDLTRLNEATGVPSISRDWLSKVRFVKPTNGEQQRIAAILTCIDNAIEATEALIEKQRQVYAGLMQDLFTRGVLVDGCLRPTRQQVPDAYQRALDDWVPADWTVKTIGKACEWYSGGTPSKARQSWWQGDMPWLSPKDMKYFELADTQDHITRQAALWGSRVMPKETVFIVVRGMILAHSFPVVLSKAEFAFNQDIKAVVGRPPLTNRFLAYWFVAKTGLFLKKTTESTHGTKRLDLRDLYSVKIGIPSEAEQQRIVERLDAASDRLNGDVAKMEKLRMQKLGLMQDLLTGRVAVKFTGAVLESAVA